MDELPSLQEMMLETITNYCASRGLGMPVGFIYAVMHIDADGEQVMTLGEADNQMTALSMGMAEYLRQTFRLDCQFQLTAFEDDD